MNFFRKLTTQTDTTGTNTRTPPIGLGSGRKLHSDPVMTDCLANLEAVIRNYRELESKYRAPYVVPGWQWVDPSAPAPETVISFDDTDGYPLFAAFWPSQSGAECALFPLGRGDERLTAMPIVGYWEQRDPSLTSIGVVPQGQLALVPPRLPERYFNEILETAGFPDSPRNITGLGLKIAEMFGSKAFQFIASRDRQSAEAFIDNHAYHGGPIQDLCQRILDDLAIRRVGSTLLLPYIQDLPMQCRAFLLERLDDTESSFWSTFER